MGYTAITTRYWVTPAGRARKEWTRAIPFEEMSPEGEPMDPDAIYREATMATGCIHFFDVDIYPTHGGGIALKGTTEFETIRQRENARMPVQYTKRRTIKRA